MDHFLFLQLAQLDGLGHETGSPIMHWDTFKSLGGSNGKSTISLVLTTWHIIKHEILLQCSFPPATWYKNRPKQDAFGLRWLNSTEVLQMCGRAGRRGLDLQGHAIVNGPSDPEKLGSWLESWLLWIEMEWTNGWKVKIEIEGLRLNIEPAELATMVFLYSYLYSHSLYLSLSLPLSFCLSLSLFICKLKIENPHVYEMEVRMSREWGKWLDSMGVVTIDTMYVRWLTAFGVHIFCCLLFHTKTPDLLTFNW